jgi:hypothetical protein
LFASSKDRHEANEVVTVWRRHAARERDTHRILILAGPAARESEFKVQAPGYRILHLATHGFFLGGFCPSVLGVGHSAGNLEDTPTGATRTLVGENPLLLSGLALAGANHREKAGPEEDDGILTAEEIGSI